MLLLNKIALSILLTFLVSYSGKSQSVFNILDSNSIYSNSVIEEDTGRLVVSSFIYGQYPGSFKVKLTRYNSNGLTLSSDTVAPPVGVTSTGLLLDHELNGFFLVNSINTIDSTQPYNDNHWDYQLSYFSDIGNTAWTGTHGAPYFESMRCIYRSVDGGVFVVGSGYQYNFWNSQTLVAKYDVFGNYEWHQYYGPINNGDDSNIGYNIVQTPDSNYLVSTRRWYGQPVFDLQGVLMKIDPLGNVIWEREYGTTQFHNDPPVITALYDQTYIINSTIDPAFNMSWTSFGSISKIDGNGDILWTKNIDYFGTTAHIFKVIENTDGTLMVLCLVQEQTNLDERTWLLKLDPFGNVIWSKIYINNPNTWNSHMWDIVPTYDSGFIMVGYDVTLPQGQTSWLVKTDCNGCEDVQYPTGQPCNDYDCSQFPIYASFVCSDTIINVGDSISFFNQSSNATSRVWNFGDGTIDYTDTTITHTYTQQGTYEVQLIVFHGTCSDTLTQTVYVVNTVGGTEISVSNEKKLIKVTDLLGRETRDKPNTPLIYIYSDGTTEKVYRME